MTEHSSGDDQLGAIVRKYRIRTGKSIRKIARESSLHHGFIARIEHGDRGLSVDTLAKLAQIFGTGFLFEYLSRVMNAENEKHTIHND